MGTFFQNLKDGAIEGYAKVYDLADNALCSSNIVSCIFPVISKLYFARIEIPELKVLESFKELKGSVGIRGQNNKADVEVVQQLLNRNLSLLKNGEVLVINGVCDDHTEANILAFQKEVMKLPPKKTDGKVDKGGATFNKLMQFDKVEIDPRLEQTFSFQLIPITKASLNQEIFLVAETLNFQSEKLVVQIKQHIEECLAKQDESIAVVVKGEETYEVSLSVGEYMSNKLYKNRDEYVNHAIEAIRLRPQLDDSLHTLEIALAQSINDYTLLYLDVKVSEETYPLSRYIWNGEGVSKNLWYYLEESKFSVIRAKPEWLIHALQEFETFKNLKEDESPLKDRIENDYHPSTTLGASHFGETTQWDAVNVPWCASFVKWCFAQTLHFKTCNDKRDKANKQQRWNSQAFGWLDSDWVDGEKCDPFVGALIILNYSHVAFLVGKNYRTDKYVYLGGNQSNGLNFGTVSIGKQQQFTKPKAFVPSELELNLPDIRINADGSHDSTR